MSATLEVFERDVVRCNESGFCASFDGHVADGHTTFHRQCLNSGATELNDITNATTGSDVADDCQDDVFGGDASGQCAVDFNAHPLGSALGESLRGEHVLNFAGSDSECQ